MLSKDILLAEPYTDSLGETPETLLAFKGHAQLPSYAGWIEKDPLIKAYLLSAEQYVDEMSNTPYRERNYVEKFRCLQWQDFMHLDLTMFPASETSIVASTDGGDVTYTEDTDYELVGGKKSSLIFPFNWVPPSTTQKPYPWTVEYTAGGSMHPMQLICIYQLAAYYYRFPESVGHPVPDSVFGSHLDAFTGSFL